MRTKEEYQVEHDYLFEKYSQGGNEDSMLLRHYLDLLQELIDNLKDSSKPIVSKTSVHCGNCETLLGDNNGWTQATVKYCKVCGVKLDFTKNLKENE